MKFTFAGFGVGGGASYSLPFGGQINAPRFFKGHGSADDVAPIVLDEKSELSAPAPGFFRGLSWRRDQGDATTTYNVYKNSVVIQVVSVPTISGALTLNGTAIVAGDLVAVQYAAGIFPGSGTVEIFIGP
jgi:hypothetical protein